MGLFNFIMKNKFVGLATLVGAFEIVDHFETVVSKVAVGHDMLFGGRGWEESVKKDVGPWTAQFGTRSNQVVEEMDAAAREKLLSTSMMQGAVDKMKSNIKAGEECTRQGEACTSTPQGELIISSAAYARQRLAEDKFNAPAPATVENPNPTPPGNPAMLGPGSAGATVQKVGKTVGETVLEDSPVKNIRDGFAAVNQSWKSFFHDQSGLALAAEAGGTVALVAGANYGFNKVPKAKIAIKNNVLKASAHAGRGVSWELALGTGSYLYARFVDGKSNDASMQTALEASPSMVKINDAMKTGDTKIIIGETVLAAAGMAVFGVTTSLCTLSSGPFAPVSAWTVAPACGWGAAKLFDDGVREVLEKFGYTGPTSKDYNTLKGQGAGEVQKLKEKSPMPANHRANAHNVDKKRKPTLGNGAFVPS